MLKDEYKFFLLDKIQMTLWAEKESQWNGIGGKLKPVEFTEVKKKFKDRKYKSKE